MKSIALAITVFSAAAACGPRKTYSPSQLSRASGGNPLRATAELKGQKIQVAGIVVDAGVFQTFGNPERNRIGAAIANALHAAASTKTGAVYIPATPKEETEDVPYLVLADSSGGAVVCYFAPNKLNEAARARMNDTAIVYGRVTSAERSPGGLVITMETCRLERP